MKRSKLCGTAASWLCVGLLTASSAAFAQETRSQPTPDEYSSTTAPQTTAPDQAHNASTHSMMKECVKRERAGDSTMSESEATKACQDALRAKRENHDNEPQPPHRQ